MLGQRSGGRARPPSHFYISPTGGSAAALGRETPDPSVRPMTHTPALALFHTFPRVYKKITTTALGTSRLPTGQMLWKFPPPLSVGPYVSHGEKGGLSIAAGIGSETKNKSYFNSRLSFHWIRQHLATWANFAQQMKRAISVHSLPTRPGIRTRGISERRKTRGPHTCRRQTMIRRRRRPLRT